jgi:KaiC/GvpD/RAD55 family RecA-like ATPase
LVQDFFLGFAAHAHTKNCLETDMDKEVEQRKGNSPEEARSLTERALSKIEKDVSDTGYGLQDVKLLILYSSYRGDNDEKDSRICESILQTIEERFANRENQLRLIGHTTAGEIENQDLALAEVTGIGYNGVSLLAVVTNLPIGVGRTFGLQTPREARTQGRELTHDAWVDFNEDLTNRKHAEMSKTLFVLTQGPTVGDLRIHGKRGLEHFLAEGIASFISNTREARITKVVGGSSGDGLIGRTFRQFHGKLTSGSGFKILSQEAVCAIIPSPTEPSLGSDVAPTRRIGNPYNFDFDPEAKPRFTDIKRIGNKDPAELFAEVIFENEARRSGVQGSPWKDKSQVLASISSFEGIPVHPAIGKYAFVFPFGNYAPVCPIRVSPKPDAKHDERIIDLAHPVRGYEATMKGYIAEIDCEKVQNGARELYKALRENRDLRARDFTLIVSCISRRLAEIMAGATSKTEPEILKEALSSTQLLGFLAYGELWVSHLLQEPYHHNFSCWGLAFRSTTGREAPEQVEPLDIRVPEAPQGRISTGYPKLDSLLLGGIPEKSTVILTSPSCEERDMLIRKFLEAGANEGETTFFITAKASAPGNLVEAFPSTFFLFTCNPQADKIVQDAPNVVKLKGLENLTDINIALTSAFRKLDDSHKGPRRICIEIVSDVLLQHHAVQTRRWLNALIPELKSNGFTTLAVVDSEIHTPQEVRTIAGVFEGEINISKRGAEKLLKVEKLTHQKHRDTEMRLRKE